MSIANPSHYRRALLLAIFLFSLLGSGQNAMAQVIPNGDGDLLWEKGYQIIGEADFQPKNGNILSIVGNELWEINPQDGSIIRIFEGETGMQYWYGWLDISNNGNYIVVSTWKGITLWDYNLGKLIKTLPFSSTTTIGIYPNSNIVLINQGNKLIKYDFITEQIIQEKIINDNNINYSRLTKDGKYIGIAKSYNNYGDWRHFMELWDAETLTKIRDFGDPGDINGFKGLKISNDNKYFGFLCDNYLQLFDSTGQNIWIKEMKSYSGFAFSPDSKKILISILYWDSNYSNDIFDLTTLKPVYRYSGWAKTVVISRNDELLFGYMGLKYYSNKWYEVGVNEPKEPQAIITPNPASDYITLNIPPLEKRELGGVLQDIRIFDVFGKCVLSVETQCIASLQRIDISTLPPGVYFISIGDKVSKFVKM